VGDTRPPYKRFWKYVLVRPRTRCWIWSGNRYHNGYGQLAVNQRPVRAHRFAYEMFVGAIPDGLLVLHRCDRPACVNPDHLWLGTTDDNMRDMVQKGRSVRTMLGKRGPMHPSYGKPNTWTKQTEESKRLIGLASQGEGNPSHKLTEPEVLAIRASTLSQWTLARMYHVSQGTISDVKVRKTWRHL
jgi:hypothetical protein